MQILTQAPELINKIGDLLFRVADFPLADEMAERLKPGLAPEAQEAIGKLQEQLQNKNRLLGEAMQSLTEERLKVKAKDSVAVVDEFRADTERAKMLLDAAAKVDPAAAMEMIHAMAREAVSQAFTLWLGKPMTPAAPKVKRVNRLLADLPPAPVVISSQTCRRCGHPESNHWKRGCLGACTCRQFVPST